MKITIAQGAFLPVPPLRGGAVEKAWFALGREFAARGHEVTHVSRRYAGLPDTEVLAGVRHLRVRGHDAPGSLKFRLLLDLFYSRRVLSALPAADIVVTNTFWLPLLYRSLSKGRPYVHVARYPKGQLRHYSRHAILQTVSEPIRQAMLAELPGAEARMTVVPYPLSEAYFAEGRPPGENTILYTGRLHPEKGLDLLVRAFRDAAPALPGWKLRIVGPWLHSQGGAGEEYLAGLRAAAGPAPVEFPGPVFDEASLISEYRRARVFCYPSLAERGETFGLSVLEAMASGAAPLVSSLGCFGDFVRHESNGLVFDHRSPRAGELLSAALIRLCHDQGLRETLARAAETTSAEYRIDRIASSYLKDFERFRAGPEPRT